MTMEISLLRIMGLNALHLSFRVTSVTYINYKSENGLRGLSVSKHKSFLAMLKILNN